jgi:rhamnogalacturonyl hydrolase YesR
MSTRFINIVVALLIVCLDTAFAQSPQGVITTPTPGSTLSGSSVTFGWTAGAGASAYWLVVGSTAGGDNYYSSGNLGNVLTVIVNGLPRNGSTLYVTLYSLIGGAWVPNAYTYTGVSAAAGGVITTPTPGSTLSGSSVTFGWTAAAGASAYWLVVGSTAGGDNYYSSGNLGNLLTVIVNGLPTNGSTLYVTLYSLIGGAWVPNAYTSGNLGNLLTVIVNGLPTNGSTLYVTLYSLIGGAWVPNAYTYTAVSAAAGGVITTPTPGSTLSGSSVTFGWTAGAGASAYWLVVGSTAGGDDYYSSGNLGLAQTTTLSSLLANGSTIYVTLYSDVGGQWLNNAYTYVADPLQLPSQAQILGAIETVNNYWIANNAAGNSDWTQATYFTGDLAAYDATGQANYLSFAQSWATEHSYSLTGGNTTTYPNYQAAGQVYIRLYQLSNNSSDVSGITESINGMVNSTVDNEWTWIDAINMSMPDFAELGSIHNNTNYYTKMYALYSYTKYSLGLYDSTTGLWWENSTYANTSTYWSRGNGWVFAAHAKVLSVLPESDPHYAEYLSTFTTMAQALGARQQPGGYWNSDLGGTDYAGPESSGTSFFLYGLAWGLNNGILDKTTYLPIVEQAWNFFVNTAIQPSGLLGYVEPSGSGPGPTSATTTEDFGVGAFLLAGRQMAMLTQ